MTYYRIVFTFLFLVLGCSSKHLTDYQVWTSQATPSSWSESDKWVFAFINENGILTQILITRFSKQPVKCCSAGNWRWLEVLEERPAPEFPPSSKHAYEVIGSHLHVIFNAASCDDNRELRGHITDLGVVGTDGWSTMFGGGEYGQFIAVPAHY